VAEKLAFVGMGRVGGALAVLLSRAAFEVVALCDLEEAAAARVAAMVAGEPLLTTDPLAAAAAADVVFITTQDRYIAAVSEQLAAGGAAAAGTMVAHVSGSLTSEALAAVAARGAAVFSLHPLQSFADLEAALRVLPGSYFCFEGDEAAYPFAGSLVAALRGRLWRLAAADKALYHAAAVVASNFFIALEGLAVDMLRQLGCEEQMAVDMLLPLVRGSLENLAARGPVAALTGPVVRGDNETVAKHLEVIAARMPASLEAYRTLARLTLELAHRQSGVTLADLPALRDRLAE